jgi:hypothetical protein
MLGQREKWREWLVDRSDRVRQRSQAAVRICHDSARMKRAAKIADAIGRVIKVANRMNRAVDTEGAAGAPVEGSDPLGAIRR